MVGRIPIGDTVRDSGPRNSVTTLSLNGISLVGQEQFKCRGKLGRFSLLTRGRLAPGISFRVARIPAGGPSANSPQPGSRLILVRSGVERGRLGVGPSLTAGQA
jgi:hypothetical protein